MAHAGVTAIMVGIMWSVQLAIYPQFRSVPPDRFGPYIARHSSRIVALLAPFAPVEIVLALLVFLVRPDGVSTAVSAGGGALLAVAWVATGFWYAPIHGRLQDDGYDRELIDRLIRTNWLRTGLWSLRGLLALSLLLDR